MKGAAGAFIIHNGKTFDKVAGRKKSSRQKALPEVECMNKIDVILVCKDVSLLFITNLVLKQLPIEVTHLALIITQQQCNTGSVTSHVASC